MSAISTVPQAPMNKSSKDKFLLVFDIPPALKKINRTDLRGPSFVNSDTVQFSVFASAIPEIIIPAQEARYSGSGLYLSTHSRDSFPPNEVKFTVDNRFSNYWAIYKWLNLLHDQVSGIFDETKLVDDTIYLEYQTDISIFGLDEYGEKTIEWVYKKSFPTILAGINYSDRDPEEIESSFTFVYSQLHARLVDEI